MAFYLEGACAVETRMMMTDYWDSWASFHHVHDLSPWLFHDSSPWLFHVLYPGGLHYLLLLVYFWPPVLSPFSSSQHGAIGHTHVVTSLSSALNTFSRWKTLATFTW